MKVGVITFHNTNNYGATLQAWALQKVLKDFGLDAGVIHYHPEAIDGLYDPLQGTAGFRRMLKKFVITRKNPDSLIRYQKFQSFLTRKFKLMGDYRTYEELQAAKLNLDAYITGSDQVWNPEHIGGFDPAYYLDFAEPGSRKIAYAASVGSDYIHPRYKEDMRKSLSSYSGISVREHSIKEEVQELTGIPVKTVLDPTMLLMKEDYEEIKAASPIKEPYILVYMIEGNEQVISLANTISISLGLPVIQRRPEKGLTNQLPPFCTADAGEFLGLVEGASYVITNSFHGTVFSILYEKPFVSVLHSGTGSGTVDLLTQLGLESHILYDPADFKDFSMFQTEDPKSLHIQMEKLKKYSTEFLVNSLELSDRYTNVQCPTKLPKEMCYGCNACVEICSAGAIHMEEDAEGFLYPVADTAKCTDNGMCRKVCIRKEPQTVTYESSFPRAFIAYNKENEIRKSSSSGGIFPALAQYVIEEKKGVVVGVRFDDNMNAAADVAETLEEARAFSGSKYVKSEFGGIFHKIKELLTEGRYVLYSGLPCECAGLRAFLQRDYDNLVICELLCHSAPSPKVFRQYVNYLSDRYKSQVVNIRFRGKDRGWKRSDCETVITLANGKTRRHLTYEDIYYRAFVNGCISRPCCSNCGYTFLNRAGDLTIGDCWSVSKVAPRMYDNKGVNMVLVNNRKALKVFRAVKEHLKFVERTAEEVFRRNHKKSTEDKRQRIAFFCELDQKPIDELLEDYGD